MPVDMPSRADRHVLYVVVAAALGAAVAFAVSLVVSRGASRHDFATAAVLCVLAASARQFPLQIAFRRRMVTDGAPLFAGLLLLPAPVAIGVAFISVGCAEITVARGRPDRRQVVFNAAQAALGIAAGAAAYSAMTDSLLPSSAISVMWASLGGAIATIAVGDLLVFCVVWAQLGLRFRRMAADWLKNRGDLPYDAVLYAAGFVAAIAGSLHVWLLLLVAIPAPVLYRAMRNQLALRRQTREAVEALADIVDERDPYTFGHCKRVSEFTETLCKHLGLAPDLTDEIVLAARVHDVGKIGIRDSVLFKPARLDEAEFDHIKQHPDIGARLTARFPDFAAGTRYIRHHHERFDGSGYPLGLAGKDIPFGARVIAVADTYDAMTSNRVYRAGLDDGVVRAEMARVSGTQLDPEVVAAWFALKSWDPGVPKRNAA
jgi:HD-GYP domain-containing protein (c-di-GMP phosphodiesterase class II)